MVSATRGMGWRRGWRHGGRRTVLLAGVLLALAPPATAQQVWSMEGAAALGKRLARSGGSGFGPGAELRLFHETASPWSWGVAAAYQSFGRFDNPVPGDYRDESQVALGPRLRRTWGASARPYVSLGADLHLVRERPATGGSSQDPGLGAYLGVGHALGGGGRGPRAFTEIGLRGVTATGEETHGNGWCLTLLLGAAWRG